MPLRCGPRNSGGLPFIGFGGTGTAGRTQGGMRMWGTLRLGRTRRTTAACVVLVALGLLPGGCFSESFQRGYVLPDGALEQIPLGASQEQVLLVLGTPSTVATVSGEAFYYISQRSERAVAFLPNTITDQRVIAVYFDKNRKVQRLAEYGLKDGKIFDFVSRTTPTSGADLSIIRGLIRTIENKGS
jgi:outer membrane protein assembly factor BamE (lipoprotein component of BamABCDE complex)